MSVAFRSFLRKEFFDSHILPVLSSECDRRSSGPNPSLHCPRDRCVEKLFPACDSCYPSYCSVERHSSTNDKIRGSMCQENYSSNPISVYRKNDLFEHSCQYSSRISLSVANGLTEHSHSSKKIAAEILESFSSLIFCLERAEITTI